MAQRFAEANRLVDQLRQAARDNAEGTDESIPVPNDPKDAA
jgi:hypothetical protein